MWMRIAFIALVLLVTGALGLAWFNYDPKKTASKTSPESTISEQVVPVAPAPQRETPPAPVAEEEPPKVVPMPPSPEASETKAEAKPQETVVSKKQDRLPVEEPEDSKFEIVSEPSEELIDEEEAELVVEESEDTNHSSVETDIDEHIADNPEYEIEQSSFDEEYVEDEHSSDEGEYEVEPRSFDEEYVEDEEPSFTALGELSKYLDSDCPPGIVVERRRHPRTQVHVYGGVPPWITSGYGPGPGPSWHHRRRR